MLHKVAIILVKLCYYETMDMALDFNPTIKFILLKNLGIDLPNCMLE